MRLVNARSVGLFVVGAFTILVARVTFRLIIADGQPLLTAENVIFAGISAAIVAFGFEYHWQRRGR